VSLRAKAHAAVDDPVAVDLRMIRVLAERVRQRVDPRLLGGDPQAFDASVSMSVDAQVDVLGAARPLQPELEGHAALEGHLVAERLDGAGEEALHDVDVQDPLERAAGAGGLLACPRLQRRPERLRRPISAVHRVTDPAGGVVAVVRPGEGRCLADRHG
jgi:hypothetical protein